MTLRFPAHFFWGSSTSATQIETASDHNWKGFRARDGFILDRTTDHEKRRDEDIEYICQFGSIYRCGVDWARLQKSPFEKFDPEVVAEYVHFFSQLEERGVRLMFVLHHFTNPQWFESQGGWLHESNVNAFVDYCRQCMQHFGQWVAYWNTFNEPNVYAMNAYFLGHFPPQVRSYKKANLVLRNLGIAHQVVYELIKQQNRDSLVGISLNTALFEGLNFLGRIPARLANWWFHKKAARPFRMVDFWGISYYAYVPFDPFPITEIDQPGKLDKLRIPHDNMWGYKPEGLGFHLRYFYKKYRKPVIVAESGICTDDSRVRIQSIKDYLQICHKVIADGIDLRGYIHWSTWDNFEWNMGPTYRFGLVRVNNFTKDRTMTEAGEFYHRVVRENAVEV